MDGYPPDAVDQRGIQLRLDNDYVNIDAGRGVVHNLAYSVDHAADNLTDHIRMDLLQNYFKIYQLKNNIYCAIIFKEYGWNLMFQRKIESKTI